MTFSRNELLGLMPLFLLAGMYWIKDMYIYNRRREACFSFSSVQKWTAVMYVLWVAFVWFNYLSIARGYLVLTALSSVARSVLGWYTLISIVNDSFQPTLQQFKGLLATLLISLTWDSTSLLILSQSDTPACPTTGMVALAVQPTALVDD